jgi:hypothetical protein
MGVWCFSGLVFSRFLPLSLLVPVLAAMLALTTPVGTGGQEHEYELLHPVFPHAHLVDGRIVADKQLVTDRATRMMDVAFSSPQPRPALGAGDGADTDGIGLGLVPTLPLVDVVLPAVAEQGLPGSASMPPDEFRDPPEEPPPNAFA